MIYHLKTPISKEDVRKLRSGDIVYISGTVVTGRDDAHKRAVVENEDPEMDLKGLVLYHAGPIVKDNTVLACGPTTSKRMEAYEDKFIEKFGISLIVGKGGMGEKTKEACEKFGTCHCIFPGGCAVISADSFKNIDNVIWKDLGMPEAMWVLNAEEFGPVIVNIDTVGGDMMAENLAKFRKNADKGD